MTQGDARQTGDPRPSQPPRRGLQKQQAAPPPQATPERPRRLQTGAPVKPHLRRYQRVPATAIIKSAAARDGLRFAVMMARQAGKNEMSAEIEAALLAANAAHPRTGVKCAPTEDPQARISRARLGDALSRLGVRFSSERKYVYLGRARWAFLSAEKQSNVIGHTCSLLLECDEAQDVAPDKWDKEFVPMAATTNATRVFYGTPWTYDDLLGQAVADASEMQALDRRQRLFKVPWDIVAEESRDYGAFVASERDRLGANHPLFLTQYELEFLPGAGRLLSAAQLAAMRGSFPRQDAPASGYTYVAAVDVAGEDPENTVLRGRDSTVMTVARLTFHKDPKTAPTAHVVTAYEWKGTPHAQLYAQIIRIAESWGAARVAVDSTAIGEALAHLLARALGEAKVIAYRFTEKSKSDLGYGLQAAATTGRFQLWANDDSPEYSRAFTQLRLCRAEYRPNRMVRWQVPASDGHDDYVAALALLAHAAEQTPRRRVATMKQ